MTGIERVPEAIADEGRKRTVIVQEAEGISVPHEVVSWKLEDVVERLPISRSYRPVFVTTMVLLRRRGAGKFRKISAAGLSESPGSGEPKPVKAALAAPISEVSFRIPLEGPVAVGLKTTCAKQDAFGSYGT